MAVITEATDHDCEEIRVAYGWRELRSVVGLTDGHSETTYLFRSDSGQYIVTIFETGVRNFEIEHAFRIMDMLSRAGLPSPTAVRTIYGDVTTTVNDKLVAVVGFVEGMSVRVASATCCRSLGRTAASFHEALGPTRKREPVDRLPSGWIHGGLTKANVFFTDDVVTGVINYRLSRRDCLVQEVADVLVRWCALPDGRLDSELSRAFLGGYCDVRAMTSVEVAVLPDFAASVAARLEAERDAQKPELRPAELMRRILHTRSSCTEIVSIMFGQ